MIGSNEEVSKKVSVEWNEREFEVVIDDYGTDIMKN